MTDSEDDLTKQRDRIFAMPSGEAKFGALDDLLRHADAAGYAQFAYETRMDAIHVYGFGGEPLRSLLTFSQCLAAYDAGVVTVGNGDESALLWRFKWMAKILPNHPQIPVAQAVSAIDDMERRYRLAGYSMRSVHQTRWALALGTGDLAAADDHFEQMVRAPHDAMSDCVTCFPAKQANHHATRGNYEEAIRIGAPATQGVCGEQPHWLLTHLLLPYLYTGRHAEAVLAHRKAYRRMRTDRKFLGGIGTHLRFCVLSGNATRGLEIVERHLDSLDRASSPMDAMNFAAGAAVVLTLLIDDGHGDVRVRRSGGAVAAPDLRDEMVATAGAIAARFDTRNANSYVTDLLERTLTQIEPIARIPLTVADGAAPEPASAARKRSTPARPRSAPKGRSQRIAALADEIAGSKQAGDVAATVRARLALARTLGAAGHVNDAIETAEEALLELQGVGQSQSECQYLLFTLYAKDRQTRPEAIALVTELLAADPHPLASVTPAELREQVGDVYVYGSEAAEHFRAAAAGFRSTGANADEFRSLRKQLFAGYGLGEDEVIAIIARGDELAETTHLADRADPDGVKAVERFAAAAIERLTQLGRLEDALNRAAAAVDRLGDSDPIEARDRARLQYARLLLRCDRAAECEQVARAVLADTEGQETALYLVARALQAQGRTEELTGWVDEHDIDAAEFEAEAEADD